MTKQSQLTALAAELEHLTNSPLYDDRIQNNYHPVPGEGNPGAAILFIGEAPGASEAKQGRPFVGASGRLLDELLDGIGPARAESTSPTSSKTAPPTTATPAPPKSSSTPPSSAAR